MEDDNEVCCVVFIQQTDKVYLQFKQIMDETTESNEESVDFDELKDRVNKLRFAFGQKIYTLNWTFFLKKTL